VRDSVLPRFVSAFIQSGEGQAPDGKDLDVWIKVGAVDDDDGDDDDGIVMVVSDAVVVLRVVSR
jgi:hypothetical protein